MEHEKEMKWNRTMESMRGSSIIDGEQESFRQDGYTNLLNKYGTKQDNSTAYKYQAEAFADDLELIRLYEGNGLFAKIINRPSEEAVKHGVDIDYGDEEISEYVEERLDELDFEDKFATAEKWARLYGGSIIVMLADDGRGLDEPLDMANVRSIEELRVFERAVVQPDYSALYNFHFMDSAKNRTSFGEPEYYQVFSMYGYFRVHRSRCLVFRNGRLPEQTTNSLYRYWGIPEYVKIKRALRECITSHEDGVKLLERSVQAIYKMKNLANLLSTSNGEDKVLQRLQVIDMARGILNSIAIDTEGEDYDFKTQPMSGVKDIIDATCNMLSAVTDIPQTILFGRSPSGMNSTGESDMENYYNMVENIQKQNMKRNARTVIDLILKQGVTEGEIKEIPKYKMKFAALWSLSEAEQIAIEQQKTGIQQSKAQTAQIYMETNVLDPAEVRKSLAKEGDYEIEDSPDGSGDLNLPEDTFDLGIDSKIGIDLSAENNKDDSDVPTGTGTDDLETGVGVLIIKDGKVLVADRSDGKGICGPGGHLKIGESPKDAAIREAMEEFGIVPRNILPLNGGKNAQGQSEANTQYFTDQFDGIPEADESEMHHARWMTLEEMEKEELFPPFQESLDALKKLLTGVICHVTLTLDGAPYGNQNAAGPHKSKGETEHTASAKGENELCKGFAKGKAKVHFEKHGSEMGCSTREEYVEKAKNFIKQKCEGDVDGYITEDGYVCRFNRKTCEYGKGKPGDKIKTYYVAKFNSSTEKPDVELANKYFDEHKSNEGVNDGET